MTDGPISALFSMLTGFRPRPQLPLKVDRRPLGCKVCGRSHHRPYRSQTCPECRATQGHERAQEKRHATELARITRMDAAELEALLSRLAGYVELARAFGGDSRALARIRIRARAAAERLNELALAPISLPSSGRRRAELGAESRPRGNGQRARRRRS